MNQFELVTPKCTLDSLVLQDSVIQEIKTCIEDFEFEDALRDAGLRLRRKILLHGPPGCGKTSIAHALAVELSMKLYSVRASQTINSHLGGSEKSTAAIFEFARNNRAVLLCDEFDSIASGRDDDTDGSASKSFNNVVNTILTEMESKEPLGLFIANTNLFNSIDKAVVRRFDAVIEIPNVNREALLTIANSVIKGRFGIDPGEILKIANSPSDVVREATNQLRKAVIADVKSKRKSPREMVKDLDRRLDEKSPKRNQKQVAMGGL